MNANPACFRPVLDLNHVELFLVWQALLLPERKDAIRDWLQVLCARLQVRRHPISGLPFIDDRNSWELAFERAALNDRSADASPKSSHLLLMLMECALVLDDPERETIMERIHTQLVEGAADDGARSENIKTLDLLSWVPPGDWEPRILAGTVRDGESITVSLDQTNSAPPTSIAARVRRFVDTANHARPLTFSGHTPLSALILATLRHQSPLPPIFWRQLLHVAEIPE